MNSLVQRVLVALVAIPLLLFATFWEQTLLFRILTALALALGLAEFCKLADRHDLRTMKIEGLVALLLLLLPWFLGPVQGWREEEAFLAGLFLLCLSFLWSTRPLNEMVTSVSVTFFGLAYFGVLGGYFFKLRQVPDGAWQLLWLYLATWAYDTGGYFAGGWWGRHRVAPLASPKKSWEGCAGGLLLVSVTLFAAWALVPIYQKTYSPIDVVVLAFLLSVFAQLGDLVESIIKRSLAAKDSGSFFPGHGGVFDRIDSLLFNAPVLFYYLTLFHH